MIKYESRRLFHQLRGATVESGISYRGLLPRLAERYGRKTRTVYAWSVGALPLPAVVWDDLSAILDSVLIMVAIYKSSSTGGWVQVKSIKGEPEPPVTPPITDDDSSIPF